MPQLDRQEMTTMARTRELTEVSDFDLAKQMFGAVNWNNSLEISPLALGDGTAFPLASGIENMPFEFDQERQGDTVVGRPVSHGQPTAFASYVSFWDRYEQAAVYDVQRPIKLPEDGTLSEPIGSLAKTVLEAGQTFKKVPGTEANIYSAYPALGAITCEVADTTELSAVEFEPADDAHGSRVNITLSGPLRVLDADYHQYTKIEGNQVLHSAGHPSLDQIEVTFPPELTTFSLPIGEEYHKVIIHEGRLMALHDEDSERALAENSISDLVRKVSSRSIDDRQTLEAAYGIMLLDLPEIDQRAHETLAELFGWKDRTDQFLDFHQYDIQEFFKQRIAEMGVAIIQEAVDDQQHRTAAAIVGPAAVRSFLLHHPLFAADR